MTCEQWVMLPTVTCNGYTLCDVVQMYPCQRYICDVCFEQLYRTNGTTVTCDGTPLQYPPVKNDVTRHHPGPNPELGSSWDVRSIQ